MSEAAIVSPPAVAMIPPVLRLSRSDAIQSYVNASE
jgi:hypothetical protein